MRRALPLAAALAAACSSTVTVWTPRGSREIPRSAEADFERLARINESVEKARNFLLSLRNDLTKTAAQVEESAQLLAEQRRALTPELAAFGPDFGEVEDLLTEAERALPCARATAAAEQAFQALDRRSVGGEELTPGELASLEPLISAVSSCGIADFEFTAQWIGKKADELRARSRAKQLEREFAKRFAREQRDRAEWEAWQEATTLLRAALSTGDHGALRARLPQAAVSGGELSGPPFSLKLAAQRGHCLLWFDDSGEKAVELTARPSAPGLQRFNYDTRDGSSELVGHGFCASHDAEVTVAAGRRPGGHGDSTPRGGSTGRLRYVTLDFERAAFPRPLATGLWILMPDPCDEVWAQMWLNPIPGSLAYVDGEPVVVNQHDVFFVGGELDSRGKALRLCAPETVRFARPTKWRGCKKITAPCLARIKGRQAKDLALVEELEEDASRATTEARRTDRLSGREYYYSPRARELIDRLEKREHAAFDRECQPLDDREKKAFDARLPSLTRELVDAPPVDPLSSCDPGGDGVGDGRR